MFHTIERLLRGTEVIGVLQERLPILTRRREEHRIRLLEVTILLIERIQSSDMLRLHILGAHPDVSLFERELKSRVVQNILLRLKKIGHPGIQLQCDC